VSVDLHIAANAEALYRAAADEFVRVAVQASQADGRFCVALAGGSTPKGLYALLADDASLRDAIPWEQTHVFWGDERAVPPDHADSNYRMAASVLLSKAPIPPQNVHRIHGEEADPHDAARAYEQELRSFFALPDGAYPRFDLVLLGLGSDAHTASLFPGTAALDERNRLAVANRVDKLDATRITLTVPVFNNARCVVFLVSGADKASALKAVIEGPEAPHDVPAQLIQLHAGKIVWLVDQGAARMLQRASGD
jgi:6-phosphogluconolactonase